MEVEFAKIHRTAGICSLPCLITRSQDTVNEYATLASNLPFGKLICFKLVKFMSSAAGERKVRCGPIPVQDLQCYLPELQFAKCNFFRNVSIVCWFHPWYPVPAISSVSIICVSFSWYHFYSLTYYF